MKRLPYAYLKYVLLHASNNKGRTNKQNTAAGTSKQCGSNDLHYKLAIQQKLSPSPPLGQSGVCPITSQTAMDKTSDFPPLYISAYFTVFY